MSIRIIFIYFVAITFLTSNFLQAHVSYTYKRATSPAYEVKAVSQHPALRNLAFTPVKTMVVKSEIIHAEKPVVEEKRVVSSEEYICAVGAYYNLMCEQILNALKHYEGGFLKTKDILPAPDAPYIIEPKTHRIWFTSAQNPQEVPLEKLRFYNQSLQFYEGKPFEHHFWCNGAYLIPQTIAAIRQFNVPVVIHEIIDVVDQFITKKLFQRFLRDEHFAYACDLARQEILWQQGGLYMDIALEQTHDIDVYFKKYEAIHLIGYNLDLANGAIGAKIDSSLLKDSLNLVNQFPKLLSEIPFTPSSYTLLGLMHWHAWRLNWSQLKSPTTSIGFLYMGTDFHYQGFGSWQNDKHTLTTGYFINAAKDYFSDTASYGRYKHTLEPQGTWLCDIAANHFEAPCLDIRYSPEAHITKFWGWGGAPLRHKAPYKIEPKTHRLWLTSPENPTGPPREQLEFYKKSLQFYKNKPFKHHFWCNGIHLIPETIAMIQSFNPPVIIHEISEIIDQFKLKPLFEKLMRDKLFSFASDIARQEILVQQGGLYNDIGIEQTTDLEHYFRKYERIQCIRWGWIDTHFIAAPKGSKFYVQSLLMIEPIMKAALQKGLTIPHQHTHEFLEARTWQLVAAMEQQPLTPVGFVFADKEYIPHGLGSWTGKDISMTYIVEAFREPNNNQHAYMLH